MAQQQAAEEAAAKEAAAQEAAAQETPVQSQVDQAALLAQLQQLLGQQATSAQPEVPKQEAAAPAPQPPVAAAQQAAVPPVQVVMVEPQKRHTGKKVVLAFTSIAAVASLALAALYAFGVLRPEGGPTLAGPGEVFLIAATDLGPNPFSTTDLAPMAPAVSAAVLTASTGVATPATAPGLYGGSGKGAVCDPQGQIDFLEQNPEKALAIVTALNNDPDVQLRDGSKLSTQNLSGYIRELTPLLLLSDTRVTNHGYWKGQPTVLQSMLQAGTAVMVDQFGTPRLKCNCGNPLLPPKPVAGTPAFVGDPWPEFNGKCDSIVPSPTPIDDFVTKDPSTGDASSVGSCALAISQEAIMQHCASAPSNPGAGGDPEPLPSSSAPTVEWAEPVTPVVKTCAVDFATWDHAKGYVPANIEVINNSQVQIDLWLYVQVPGSGDACTSENFWRTIMPGEKITADSTEGYTYVATSPGIGDYGTFVVPATGGVMEIR